MDPSGNRYLTMQQQKLARGQKNAEELIKWEKRMDEEEEKQLYNSEKRVLKVWDKKDWPQKEKEPYLTMQQQKLARRQKDAEELIKWEKRMEEEKQLYIHEKALNQNFESESMLSDLEKRIQALHENLRKRKNEADRLKRERKEKRKEMVKNQEETLKRQIEAYDNQITQLKQDLHKEKSQGPAKTKICPVIKQPKVPLKKWAETESSGPDSTPVSPSIQEETALHSSMARGFSSMDIGSAEVHSSMAMGSSSMDIGSEEVHSSMAMGSSSMDIGSAEVPEIMNLPACGFQLHDVNRLRVQSLIFLRDNHIILGCHAEGLKLLDSTFQTKATLPIRAIATCKVSDSEILVSQGKHARVQFIQIFPNILVKKALNVGRHCNGVDFHNNEIYITCHDNPGNGEVRVLDRNGTVQRSLGFVGMFTWPVDVKVTRNGDRVIVADKFNHGIVCLNQQGGVIFQYISSDLRKPRGFMLDDHDNIVICGELSHNVHVISKHGEKRKILVSAGDGIRYPLCVAYRESDGSLLVGLRNKSRLSLCTFTTKL